MLHILRDLDVPTWLIHVFIMEQLADILGSSSSGGVEAEVEQRKKEQDNHQRELYQGYYNNYKIRVV